MKITTNFPVDVDFLKDTAFRWFGQGGDNYRVLALFFDADINEQEDFPFPTDSELDGKIITGVSCLSRGEYGTNLFPLNGINYVPVTIAQAAQFTMNLREEEEGEKLVWEDFPLSRVCDQHNGHRGNMLKTRFQFFTNNSFLRKTGSTAIVAPYVVPLLFCYEK